MDMISSSFIFCNFFQIIINVIYQWLALEWKSYNVCVSTWTPSTLPPASINGILSKLVDSQTSTVMLAAGPSAPPSASTASVEIRIKLVITAWSPWNTVPLHVLLIVWAASTDATTAERWFASPAIPVSTVTSNWWRTPNSCTTRWKTACSCRPETNQSDHTKPLPLDSTRHLNLNQSNQLKRQSFIKFYYGVYPQRTFHRINIFQTHLKRHPFQ